MTKLFDEKIRKYCTFITLHIQILILLLYFAKVENITRKKKKEERKTVAIPQLKQQGQWKSDKGCSLYKHSLCKSILI